MGLPLFFFGMFLLFCLVLVALTPWSDVSKAPKWFNDACKVVLVNSFTFMAAGLFVMIWG